MTLPSGATHVRRAGAGNINKAFRLVLADGGEAFVKTRADPGPGEYAAEAAGACRLDPAAYEEGFPLAEGWRERVGLYQLFPLLVHAALFGGSYGASAERAALRRAG